MLRKRLPQQPRKKVAARPQLSVQQALSPFLSLPTELRCMIYEHLVDWGPIANRERLDVYGRSTPQVPAIFLINRQTRSEALWVLYQQPLVLTFQWRDSCPYLISTSVLKKAQHATLKFNLKYETGYWGTVESYDLTKLVSRCYLTWYDGEHRLQSLNMEFVGPDWEKIMSGQGKLDTWENASTRKLLKRFILFAQSELAELRGIEKVTLKGRFAQQLLGDAKGQMESAIEASDDDTTRA